MYKGVNKRIVEIKNPKGELFDRAILFLKDNEERSDGEIELLSGEYIRYLSETGKVRRRRTNIKPLLWALLGALSGGMIIYFIK